MERRVSPRRTHRGLGVIAGVLTVRDLSSAQSPKLRVHELGVLLRSTRKCVPRKGSAWSITWVFGVHLCIHYEELKPAGV